MPPVQPPPFETQFQSGDQIAELWQQFLLDLQRAVDTGAAPADAQYLVATANADLTAERNLGLLATGYLRITVALGVATPSSAATIPATDLSGTLSSAQEPAHTGDVTNAAGSLALALVNIPALSGANLTNLNANALATGTVPNGRFPATLPAASGVNLTNLTGTQVNHGTATIVFADSPYSVPAGVEVVLVNAVGGAVTVNLPAPTSGRMTSVKKIDASINAVTVDGLTGNIDGAATVALPLQWNSVMVDSDGTDFFILAQV